MHFLQEFFIFNILINNGLYFKMEEILCSIFYNLQEFIETSPLYRKYYFLFQSIDLSDFSDGNTGVGCTGYPRRAIFRAFIVKHLEEIKTVPRLIEYLENHPVITDLCGFDMRKNLPDESQFYRFLKTTNNSVLEAIHHRINKKLIKENMYPLNNTW